MDCPKCRYIRAPTDIGPGYECPKCGIVYAKFDPTAAERTQANRVKVAARSLPHTSLLPTPQSPQLVAKTAFTVKADLSAIDAQENGAGGHADDAGRLLRGENIAMPGNTAVCKHCEEVGRVTTKLPGNGWIEFTLYLLCIAPGIIYSVWRRKGLKQVCAACGSEHLIAAKTRLGRQIIADQFPLVTLGADAPSGVTKPPTFGKLMAVVLGFIAINFLLGAVGAAIGLSIESAFTINLSNYLFIYPSLYI